MHGWSARYDDRRTTGPADLLSIRRSETCFTRNGVPGLGARMSVFCSGHPRREYGFHILGGVHTRSDRERLDFADMFSVGATPIRIIDSQQPNFSKSLQDRASSCFRGVGGLTCRESVEVPKCFSPTKLSNRIV